MTKYNLKGFLVGNGATDWNFDVDPAFPDVVYNFNLITKEDLDTYKDNNCHYYFNNFRHKDHSTEC